MFNVQEELEPDPGWTSLVHDECGHVFRLKSDFLFRNPQTRTMCPGCAKPDITPPLEQLEAA